MELKSKLSGILIPKFNRNRELPEVEQVAVHIKYPTSEEYERLAGGKTGAIALVRECVPENAIKNLAHNGNPVTNGRELVRQVRGLLSDLIVEIYTDIITANRLTEDEEKNSDGQSS